MGINNSLLKSIQTLVDKAINIAPFDKTRQAQIITNNDDGTYTIRLDGVLYNNIPSYPNSNKLIVGMVVKVVIPSNQTSQMYIKSPLPDVVNDSVPIGAIQAYGGETPPEGWFICDGRALSRTDYAELFEAIGTNYGDGDGSTTFNIPNLKGRVVVGVGESSAEGHTNHTLGQSDGEETHTLTTAQMPSHNHLFQYSTDNGSTYTNANMGRSGTESATQNNYLGVTNRVVAFATYRNRISYTGSGGAHNNMQPYVATNYIIKAKEPQPIASSVISNFLEVINILYPVGCYYETSDSSFDPNTAWGGTWVLETEGQVHVSAGSSYVVGNAGGATTSTVPTTKLSDANIAHGHGFTQPTVNGGSHRHYVLRQHNNSGSGSAYVFEMTSTAQKYSEVYSGYDGGHTHSVSNGAVSNLSGASSTRTAHGHGSVSTMQPYIAVNRWHRTA